MFTVKAFSWKGEMTFVEADRVSSRLRNAEGGGVREVTLYDSDNVPIEVFGVGDTQPCERVIVENSSGKTTDIIKSDKSPALKP